MAGHWAIFSHSNAPSLLEAPQLASHELPRSVNLQPFSCVIENTWLPRPLHSSDSQNRITARLELLSGYTTPTLVKAGQEEALACGASPCKLASCTS